jgi:thioredoxin reductase (NADPH)
MSENIENVIIIGSWPAWHTAWIYTARANLTPLMFEWFMAWWVAAWWQLTTTTEVENFPWFEHIDGTELMMKMRSQNAKNWTRIVTKTVDKVDLSKRPFSVTVGQNIFLANSIIIATWATAKKLNIAWEKEFRQKWISACAVCDWWLPIYRGKHLVVIGGWDTAVEEATYLSKFASKVSVIVRRDTLRASKVMQDRLFANPKIEMIWNTNVIEAKWSNLLEKLVLQNNNWEIIEIEAQWLFYAIGHEPMTKFLEWQIELDETGYIKTHEWTKTNIEWVFACWDVQDKIYRQAITAAWSGCMAALDCERRLGEQ